MGARGSLGGIVGIAPLNCQSCGNSDFKPVINLGAIPSANVMTPDSPRYPANVVKCVTCSLVQLDTVVDPHLIFPPDYPYTSGTTASLRANFAELVQGANLVTGKYGKVLDIGSNDGTLLQAFYDKGWYPHGVEPTDQAIKSRAKGIQTTQAFFDEDVAKGLGTFDVVTSTNVVAHIADIHSALAGVRRVLKDGGVFITEHTYWGDTLAGLQYDTIYHEHLRYYTLTSLSNLLNQYVLQPFRVERIPTMGGSIRVYAAYDREDDGSVTRLLKEEASDPEWLLAEANFPSAVAWSKKKLLEMIPAGTYGIGAPSRATTLLNYTGIPLEAVCEIAGSDKIGKVIPGTTIPVVDEARLYEDQPEHALLLSWHLAKELMPKIRAKGFKGKFIIPLPTPRIV